MVHVRGFFMVSFGGILLDAFFSALALPPMQCFLAAFLEIGVLVMGGKSRTEKEDVPALSRGKSLFQSIREGLVETGRGLEGAVSFDSPCGLPEKMSGGAKRKASLQVGAEVLILEFTARHPVDVCSGG